MSINQAKYNPFSYTVHIIIFRECYKFLTEKGIFSLAYYPESKNCT